MGTDHTWFYELFEVQEIMNFILAYSIFVALVFIIWLVFVAKMYRKLDK
ncbi:Hypothetical protein I595_2762 [Croceitalea dokdonensis DOKDO 023]|uniref:Uncharacterized protein n=1 Tax=Croceitalea dokdonensis DOKDO 023 TaxID=1300341 RepID=A0A0P7AUJ6_9FLAO|nr:Hypothetical protein I595_2762 [Croceitalea dokdonensis DOKDO 023]